MILSCKRQTHLKTESINYVLPLNKTKTKIMLLFINETKINRARYSVKTVEGSEIVEEFARSLINEQWGRRIDTTRSITTRLKKICEHSAIFQNNRLKLVRAFMFPTATYAPEKWITKATLQRIVNYLKCGSID